MLLLYDAVFTLFLIFYLPYSLLKALFRKSPRDLLAHRFGQIPHGQTKRPVWIHASSVGEVICSIPLFKKIKENFPEAPLVISTMTQTGNTTAKALMPDANGVLFFPFDHPLIVSRALKRMMPRLLLIAETELWPNVLLQCGRRKIPILLFNGRISDKSSKGYLLLQSIFMKCLRAVSLFLMQTEEDRGRIIKIGAPPDRAKVMGNMKFDQTFQPVSVQEREAMARSLRLNEKKPLFIAGSTHSGEETVLLKFYKDLRALAPDLRLILAPRHLDRLEEVEQILRENGVPWVRRTASPFKGDSMERESLPPVVLLDTMGELMRLYSLATLVFIGGTLVPIGGHNPLEPLAFKRCVLFGPYMFHFSEIAKKLIEEDAAIQVQGEEELFAHLGRLLTDEKARTEMGEKGYQFLLRHRGATERVFQEIRPFLDNPKR